MISKKWTRRRSVLFLCGLTSFATSALAQQYTIKNLVFDGKTPYSQAALEAASGLRPGDTISKPDLQAASQRLVDTGAFEDLVSSLMARSSHLCHLQDSGR